SLAARASKTWLSFASHHVASYIITPNDSQPVANARRCIPLAHFCVAIRRVTCCDPHRKTMRRYSATALASESHLSLCVLFHTAYRRGANIAALRSRFGLTIAFSKV